MSRVQDGWHVRWQRTDTVTVMDRLLLTGLSLEQAEEHLRAGRVEVNGELVTDPYWAAPPPARLVLVAG